MFKAFWILTQTPGLNWYRCASFAKHMGIETELWPKWVPDKLPNFEEVLQKDRGGQMARRLLEDVVQRAVASDIIIAQRMTSHEGQALLYALKDHWKKTLLTEIDDNAFGVDSSNPAYANTRPGTPKSEIFKGQLALSDGVITSTKFLKDVYEAHCKKVHIVRNGIDFGVWDRIPKPKTKNKVVKIGWEGAWHHHDDLEILSGVIPKILKKYKVEFHFFGWVPDYLKGCVIEHKDVPIDRYPKMMKRANMDIMLAPLVDTAFNRGKSNLRVLEAGAMRKAVVASKTPLLPYAQTIDSGENGLLAGDSDEWLDCIGRLIEDRDYRERLGENLYRKVKNDYNVKQIAKEYEKILVDF